MNLACHMTNTNQENQYGIQNVPYQHQQRVYHQNHQQWVYHQKHQQWVYHCNNTEDSTIGCLITLGIHTRIYEYWL